MKKTASLVLTVLLLFSAAFCVPVSAASSLSITKADIDAVINTDGTVSVTEVWTVEYPEDASGGFTRWIDIYDSAGLNEMSLLQKYDEVKDVSVKINGKAVSQSSAGDSFTSEKSEDGRSFNIDINSLSADSVKEYTIAYTLTGAVKKAGGKADFSFMVIGKAFQLTSNNVTVNVTVPSTVASSEISLPDDSKGEITGNTVTFTSKRVYDTLAVEVMMPDSVFEDGALASYSASKARFDSLLNGLEAALPWIIAVLVIAAVIIFILSWDRIRRRSAERGVTKTLSKESLESATALPTEKSPCEIYKMLQPYSKARPKSTSKKVPLLFGLSVLECIEKGYIIVEGDDLIVGAPEEEIPAYTASTLNFLKEFCSKKDDRCVIDSSFAERVKAECSRDYDLISNYLATFYSLVPSVNGKFFKDEANRELYEKSYAVKLKIMKSKSKITYEDCVGSVLAGESAGSAEIFAFMYSSLSPSKLFKCSTDSAAAALSFAVGNMYSVFIKSK